VPQEQWAPGLEREVGLGQLDQRSIAGGGVEAAVEDLGDVDQPGVARGADEVVGAQSIEVGPLGLREVPGREHGVGLGDHRALDDGEGGDDLGP
jgi:hypothetical protein